MIPKGNGKANDRNVEGLTPEGLLAQCSYADEVFGESQKWSLSSNKMRRTREETQRTQIKLHDKNTALTENLGTSGTSVGKRKTGLTSACNPISPEAPPHRHHILASVHMIKDGKSCQLIFNLKTKQKVKVGGKRKIYFKYIYICLCVQLCKENNSHSYRV